MNTLLNPAGEAERDRCSAPANAAEALIFASVVLLGSWVYCYEFGIVRGHLAAQDLTSALLKIGLLWALGISPWLLHRDAPGSLGLGNPRELFPRAAGGHYVQALIALGLVAGLIVVGMTHWPLTARFFKLPAAAQHWSETAGGLALMLAFCVAVAVIFATWFIRYDNFGASLWAAVKAAWPLVPLAAVIAFVHRGAAAFTVLASSREWLDILAYVFWGGIQQTLFTGWFSARVRKGFGPMQTWRGRLAVAALSASFFGLIHLPSYRLVAVTWALGTIFAWLAMEDRYRNVAAFAVVHGVLGATVAKLFSGDSAGALRIRFRVGPWNAAGDRAVTWVAVACVCVYVAAGVWVLRRRKGS
jgi:hypothetical protein